MVAVAGWRGLDELEGFLHLLTSMLGSVLVQICERLLRGLPARGDGFLASPDGQTRFRAEIEPDAEPHEGKGHPVPVDLFPTFFFFGDDFDHGGSRGLRRDLPQMERPGRATGHEGPCPVHPHEEGHPALK